MLAHLLAPLAVPALLFAAPPASAPACAPAAALGPPAICFPIEIGDARSLPWDAGAFARDGGYDLERLPADTRALLDASDDPLVHMETLRRAVLYVSGVGRREGAPESAARLRHALVSSLRARVIEAVLAADGPEALAPGAEALRWFDLGYLLGALDQVGAGPREPYAEVLARAAALRPDDGALHLGVALASWEQRDGRHVVWKHLDAALARAGDPRGALAVNLLSTAGAILGCDTHEELRAEVDEHLG